MCKSFEGKSSQKKEHKKPEFDIQLGSVYQNLIVYKPTEQERDKGRERDREGQRERERERLL
jgi:hypothetical protein